MPEVKNNQIAVGCSKVLHAADQKKRPTSYEPRATIRLSPSSTVSDRP